MRRTWHLLCLSIIAWHVCSVIAADSDAPPRAGPSLDPVPEGRALLYVFNGSGKTLVASAQNVELDGQRVAKLPRMTYAVLPIDAGSHQLEAVVRKIEFTATADERSFIFVAYRPGRSWAFPLGGDPVVLTEIAERDALDILAQFERR